MSSRLRFIWSRLIRCRENLKLAPIIATTKYTKYKKGCNLVLPYSVGFSLFTWLGFVKPLSAEDELVDTIKHCVLFIQKSDYEKAEQLLHVALRQAQQIQHELGVTYIYDVMANLALERNQLEKAKKLFIEVTQRIMADGATDDDLRVVHISVKLARVSHLKKEYSTAQLGYDWCLQKLTKSLSQEPNDTTKKLLAMTEDWYGRMFLECNQYEQGLNLMISSLNHMKEVTDVEKEHIVIQLNDIGTVCEKLNRIDEGLSYLQEAIELGKNLEMDEIGTMYVNLGRAYIKKNLLNDARKNCGRGWKLGVLSNNKDIRDEAESCLKEIKMLR